MRTKGVLLMVVILLTGWGLSAKVYKVGNWSSGGQVFRDITGALAGAVAGDEIWVASDGAEAYYEAELMIPAGVSVYGGFSGGEKTVGERNFALHVIVLDGRGAHRVATVAGLLDGFTLRNGRTGDNGGGVLVKSGGTVDHCIAFANEAGYDGGGIFAEEGAVVKNTLINDNRAGNDGAALGGNGGYRSINTTAVGNRFTAVPVIAGINTPDTLDAGSVLDVAVPAITDDGGSTVLVRGWELDGNAISMPYTVTYVDNGKSLRYWAANAVGVGVSNEVIVAVNWIASFRSSLLTPMAVCEGATLQEAGLIDPDYGPSTSEPGVVRKYYLLASGGGDDDELTAGLAYPLKYTDNGRLLVCRIYKDDVLSAESPAVRVAVQKAPRIHLSAAASLSVEDGERLCLPSPYISANGADLTSQGWKWETTPGTPHDFTSCDKADRTAMDSASVYYIAENSCGRDSVVYVPSLVISEPVGEFMLTADRICAGSTLGSVVAFNDGSRIDGVYTLGSDVLADFSGYVLTADDHLKVLKYTYNGGKSERRLTLQIHPVPSIITAPTAPSGDICRGGNYTLRLSAAGDLLSYRWEQSADGTTGWTTVDGATDNYLNLNVDTTLFYRCGLTGACIAESAGVTDGYLYSDAVRVGMSDRPEIGDITPPEGGLTLCEQSPVSGLLQALIPVITGGTVPATPATEGWTLGGIKIPSGYTVTAADHGKLLGYWALNGCGETMKTYETALQVDTRPVILQDPSDAEVQAGSHVRLSVRASGGDTLSYQWEKKGAGESAFLPIPGATTNTYSFMSAGIPNITVDRADTLYRCVVTTDNVCVASDTSAAARVLVIRPRSNISIVRQPAGYEQCDTIVFTELGVEVSGTGAYFYKWYKSGESDPVQKNEEATPAVKSIYLPSSAGTYYCVITGTDDTTGVRSQQAVVTAYLAPSLVTVIPDSSGFCEGGTVTIGASAEGEGLTYQWYESAAADQVTGGTLCPGANSRTFTPLSPVAGADGKGKKYYYYCSVGSKYCPSVSAVPATAATVTVSKSPEITGQPVSQSICSGSSAELTVTAATDKPDGYTWYLNGKEIAGATADRFMATKGGIYTCRVSSAECGSVTSTPALLTVAGVPEVSLGTATELTACKGDLITLPSPVIETNGSLIRTDTTGWYDGDVLVSSVMVTETKTYHYHLTYKCSPDADETTLTAGLPSFKVSLKEGPAIRGVLSALTKNAGDKVTAAELSPLGITVGTDNTLRWLLGGTPVSLPYTVRAGDNGKSFECMALSACDSTVYLMKGEVHDTAVLTVNVPVITTQPLSVTVCEDRDTALTVVASHATAYQWYKDGVKLAGKEAAKLSLTGRLSDAGSYLCEVTGAGVTLRTSAAAVVVNAKAAITGVSAEMTVCAGIPATLQAEATGYGLNYAWTVKNGADTLGRFSSLTVSPDSTTTYTCFVRGGCTSGVLTRNIRVLVNNATVITAQPASQHDCTYGQLSVGATGKGLNYQWYKDGKSLPMATDSTYTPLLDGAYTCMVTGTCGRVISAPAQVTLRETFSVPENIMTDASSVCPGIGVVMTLDGVRGDSVTYAWTEKNKTVVLGKASTLTVVPSATTTYVCTVKGKCNTIGMEREQKITLKQPTVITKQPVGGSVCDNPWSLTVVATGEAPLTFAWTKDGEAIAGVDKAQYTVPATNTGTHVYQCVVTGACGTLSDAVTVTIGKSPEIITDLTTMKVCAGDIVVLPAVSVKTNGSVVKAENTGWYNTMAPTKRVSSWRATDTTDQKFYYKVTYSCIAGEPVDSVKSNFLTITPEIPVTITKQPLNEHICTKGVFKVLTVETARGSGKLAYQWYNALGAISNAKLISYRPVSPGIYYCAVSNACSSVNSAPAVLTDTVALAADVTATADSLCAGSSLQLTAEVTAGEPKSWQWKKGSTEISGATAPKLTVNAAGTYTCVVKDVCGNTKTITKTISVQKPTKISLQPEGGNWCNSDVSLSVKADGARLTYAWTRNDTVITGAMAPLLRISGFDTGTRVYQCSVTGTCGTVLSDAVRVTIGNTPEITVADTTRITACIGDIVTLPAVAVKANGSAVNAAKTGWINTKAPGIPLKTWKTWRIGDAKALTFVYRVTYTCGRGPESTLDSDTLKVIPESPVTITKQPLNEHKCKPTIFKPLTVKADGGGKRAYQWYNASGPLKDAISDTYAPDSAGIYYCAVSNKCSSANSAPAVLTDTAALAAEITAKAEDLCPDSTLLLTAKVTAGEPKSWQWKKGNTEISGATAQTLTVNAAGTYTCVVKDVSGNTITTLPKTIGQLVATKITAQPLGKAVCEQGYVMATTAEGEGPLTYAWTRDDTVTGVKDREYQVSQFYTGTHVYQCAVTAACGTVLSNAVTVTIGRKPEIKKTNLISIRACIGDIVTLPAVSVKANGSVVVAEQTGWTLKGKNPDPNMKTWRVKNDTTLTFIYRVTYVCGMNASARVDSDTLRILPQPPVTITKQPVSEQRCTELAFKPLKVEATGGGVLKYQWYNAFGPISGQTADQLNAQCKDSAGIYYCAVSNNCSSANSAPAVRTAYENLVAKVIAPEDSICPGASMVLSVKVTKGEPKSWQWIKGTDTINGATAQMLTVNEGGLYKCKVTDICDVSWYLSKAIVMKKATTITTQPVDAAVCYASKDIEVVASAAWPTKYTWTKNDTLIPGATALKYKVLQTNKGSHVYQCSVTGACGTVLSRPVTIRIDSVPEVSKLIDSVELCDKKTLSLPELVVKSKGSAIDPLKTGWIKPGQPAPIYYLTTGSAANNGIATYVYQVTYKCGDNAYTTKEYNNFKIKTLTQPTIDGNWAGIVRSDGGMLALPPLKAKPSGTLLLTYNNKTYNNPVGQISVGSDAKDGPILIEVSNKCGSNVALATQPEAVLSLPGFVSFEPITVINRLDNDGLIRVGVTMPNEKELQKLENDDWAFVNLTLEDKNDEGNWIASFDIGSFLIKDVSIRNEASMPADDEGFLVVKYIYALKRDNTIKQMQYRSVVVKVRRY